MSNLNNQRKKSIIIIGAGLGGLSSGVYAQMNGYDSTIFEMHEIPGGCCTAWDRRNYTFDQCVSWLLGSGKNNKMNQIWNELGALDGKQIINFEVFNRVYTQSGAYVDFYSEPGRLQEHLLEIAPEDEKQIKLFCSDLRKFYALTDAHPFLKPVGLMNPWEKFRMYAPYLIRMKLVGRAYSTPMSEFSSRFKNPVLREAFNFILFEKHESFPLIPFYFNLACAALKNAGAPQGGSLGLAKSIERRYHSLGGRTVYNAKVEEILIEDNKAVGVLLTDGQRHYSDIVISAGDGFGATQRLLGGKYPNPELDKLYLDMINERALTFPSYFTMFLAVNKDYADKSHCATYVLSEEMRQELPGMMHPSINVQVRNQYYPHIAPKGKSVLYISFFCDYKVWEQKTAAENGNQPVSNKLHTKRRRTLEYRQAKKKTAKIIIEFLAKHYEGLVESIEFSDIGTPLTQERYTGNHHGTVLAWQPFLPSGEFVEHSVKKNGPKVPGLENFYMSGHWTTTGGLIRAASSGRHVIQYLCKDEAKPFKAYIGELPEQGDHLGPLSHMPDMPELENTYAGS
ncbi:MAG TPA: NAD(P)/FAD-dependent oxidoreductase [Burkholderiaceae bacterium]